MLRKQAVLINIIFAGIIGIIFLYSGFFSAEKNEHPIKCQIYEKTGKPCPTCGFTRSFSKMVTLDLAAAKKYNPIGVHIFYFFLIQFIIRIILSIYFYYTDLYIKIIVKTDIIISVFMFVYFFKELILLGF